MQLLIRYTPAEGAIVRILGLIERRGYVLGDLSVRDEATDSSLLVSLEPRDSTRRLDVLARQVGRLIEVEDVAIPGPAGISS